MIVCAGAWEAELQVLEVNWGPMEEHLVFLNTELYLQRQTKTQLCPWWLVVTRIPTEFLMWSGGQMQIPPLITTHDTHYSNLSFHWASTTFTYAYHPNPSSIIYYAYSTQSTQTNKVGFFC